MHLKFITATRLSMPDFQQSAPLAHSLKIISTFMRVNLQVRAENKRPLADIYNAAIASAEPEDILVFIHDDVWINDWLIATRLLEALHHFDVVGVAGSTQSLGQRESWILDENNQQCRKFVSGAIAHHRPEGSQVSMYGLAPAEVKLLDGVFLACRVKTLREKKIGFDPALAFHFCDMDFCRQCEMKGLKMGTWPIAITHASAGSGWRSPEWQRAWEAYRLKWDMAGR